MCVTCIRHYNNANCTGCHRSRAVALLTTWLHIDSLRTAAEVKGGKGVGGMHDCQIFGFSIQDKLIERWCFHTLSQHRQHGTHLLTRFQTASAYINTSIEQGPFWEMTLSIYITKAHYGTRQVHYRVQTTDPIPCFEDPFKYYPPISGSSSKRPLSYRFPYQTQDEFLPKTCHIPRASHRPRFYRVNTFWWGMQMKTPHYEVFSSLRLLPVLRAGWPTWHKLVFLSSEHRNGLLFSGPV